MTVGWILGAGLVLMAAMALILRLRRRVIVVSVEGISMKPTLRNGDRVMARRIPARKLAVGQVIVLELPYRNNLGDWFWQPEVGGLTGRRWIIKRIAAVSGDPVPPEIAPAVGGPSCSAVPNGKVLVLGDNADASIDSRSIGYVPVNRVLGIALRRFGETGSLSARGGAPGDPDTSKT